ncbi:uncharacterized protein PG986_003650 [Apiospora aurea]|uniref:Uncharacterized protein n=1 Tax=Apiospora aurea TaxID=335848 RepID=A0ABR1QSA7_9PEZI
MNIEYTHREGVPTDPFEVAVMEAGYRWVRTNSIVATRPGEFKPDLPIDRLNSHKHSGHNTHLIVAGDLTFEIEKDYYDAAKFKRKRVPPAFKSATLDAADPDARKELFAAREHRYKATSKSGCSFVEGHQCLSPTTAERFIARDTLRAIPLPRKGETEEDVTPWPDQDEIRALLRTAKWYPSGVPGLDNTLKPEMVWEEDASEEVDKPRTLRNGKIRPELNSKKGKTGSKRDKTKDKAMNDKHNVGTTPAAANAKKMLADWFKQEWKDFSRNSHREPNSVRYDDLYHYDDSDQEGDGDSTESEDVREDEPMGQAEKPEKETKDDPKTMDVEDDDMFEMEDV